MTILKLKYKLKWLDKSFIKSFPKTFKQISKHDHDKIKNNFIKIFNNEINYIADSQSQSFIIMCSYVTAYYNFLNAKGYSKDLILNQLYNSLIKSAGGKYVTFFTKLMLRFTRDKRKFIEKSAIQSKKSYGKFLEIREKKEKDKFVSVVTKCGIHDFFIRRQIPELTSVFCKWDNLWADEINKYKCGIEFNRTSTIAEADDTCRFEFIFK